MFLAVCNYLLVSIVVSIIPFKVISFGLFRTSRISSIRKMTTSVWHDLLVLPQELTPSFTLNTGQCFNWEKVSSSPVWIGMVENIPIAIREGPTSTEFASLVPSMYDNESVNVRLQQYFQLKYNLGSLYDEWSTQCDRMAQITSCLPGVRVVQQDPWECLISFICSSNNNISRITQMLNKLRYHYGDYVCTVTCNANGDLTVTSDHPLYSTFNSAGTSIVSPSSTEHINGRPVLSGGLSSTTDSDPTVSTHHCFSFPSPESLASAREDDLRALGMGYRAKFIRSTAQKVAARPEGGRNWLLSLRDPQTTSHNSTELLIKSEKGVIKVEEDTNTIATRHRQTVQQTLQSLDGVGPKVADCVALFSLDQSGIVPVDTHVWSIVNRDYADRFIASRTTTDSKLLKSTTSLTKPVYECVGNVFRSIFGGKAGWAHSVLFAAELPEFRKRLPEHLQREMKTFEEAERINKKLVKDQKKIGRSSNDNDNVEDEAGDSALVDFSPQNSKKAAKKRKM